MILGIFPAFCSVTGRVQVCRIPTKAELICDIKADLKDIACDLKQLACAHNPCEIKHDLQDLAHDTCDLTKDIQQLECLYHCSYS